MKRHEDAAADIIEALRPALPPQWERPDRLSFEHALQDAIVAMLERERNLASAEALEGRDR